MLLKELKFFFLFFIYLFIMVLAYMSIIVFINDWFKFILSIDKNDKILKDNEWSLLFKKSYSNYSN